MSEQERIDALALALFHAGEAAGGPSPSTRKRGKFWRAVAAEAHRQTLWARYQAIPPDGRDYVPAMTLAPEGWPDKPASNPS